MSLIRQVWLLLLATVLLAFACSAVVVVTSARDLLQTQLRVKNSDNAAALALALSQQKGDPALMALLLTAQFDTGTYRRVQWLEANGTVAFNREAAAIASSAPAWFKSAVPIASPPGIAQLSDGWHALGQVQVESQVAYAHDALWSTSVRTALAMAVVGALAAAMGWLAVRRIRRPLEATVRQAQALERGQFITVAEPRQPELQRVARGMNSLVERLRVTSSAQAEQLGALHQQAHADVLTGLANRQYFLSQLDSALQREDGPAEGALVLLRLMNLAALNRQLGHAATDRLLVTLAHTLRPYGDRVKGCFLGRLNGADFALCLPAAGVTRETAEALSAALRLLLPPLASGAAVCVGALELQRGMVPALVMGMADAALARAELRGAFAVEVAAGYGGHDSDKPTDQAADKSRRDRLAGKPFGGSFNDVAQLGEAAWRARILQAIEPVPGQASRLRLMEFPLLNSAHQLVHLECPLRLQLEPGGAFEPASRWLPLAVRSRLTSDVDTRAVILALTATERDGRPRGVNLSPASLGDSGFATRLSALLWAAPEAAKLLWLEVTEAAAADRFELLQELGHQLRPTGVHFGIEHAGERLSQIPRLFEAGLDFIKLDAAVTANVSTNGRRALFVRSTVTLLHGWGLQVYAEGVADPGDCAHLWDCGIDGQTGPWITGLAAAANA
jgi:diguanylate cyclase (GGDEF)-like protein